MRHQYMLVNCQRVLRADISAVNGFEGMSSSKKVTQAMKSSERFAKGPTASVRYLPSLPWDLRSWTWSQVLQIDIMARFRCQIEPVPGLLRSDSHRGDSVAYEWSIKKETSDPVIRNHNIWSRKAIQHFFKWRDTERVHFIWKYCGSSLNL